MLQQLALATLPQKARVALSTLKQLRNVSGIFETQNLFIFSDLSEWHCECLGLGLVGTKLLQ